LSKRPRARIERHLPPIGTSLTAKFNGKHYDAVIVEVQDYPEGKAVKSGKVLYRSMTAAAKAMTNQSTNGWRFWKIKE
jgi:hypothetical protein